MNNFKLLEQVAKLQAFGRNVLNDNKNHEVSMLLATIRLVWYFEWTGFYKYFSEVRRCRRFNWFVKTPFTLFINTIHSEQFVH